MSDFGDFLSVLEEDEFEERPVSIEEFVTSKDFLGLPPLSDYQYTMIKASTQVYKKDTLIKLYGEEEGKKRSKQTCGEVIFQLGKGSGKDYVSTISCAYVVYLLLCLKDPARYYGKPPGDAIDIINIAINAEQAKRVFFKGFLMRLERSPWFAGKYDDKVASVAFPKSITVHSGHSQRESWEGYNVIMVILDEISGFELESTSGHAGAKTADAIYKMYRASVASRFPDVGKLILLSFPRFKNDYIQQRYNEAVAEKEIVIRKHTFKLDEDLPDDAEGNTFDVEWEEDHIISYKVPKVFALKRPTWDINPTRKITDFAIDFYSDPVDSLSRFACMPPESIDAFFKSREKIEAAFVQKNGVDERGAFENHFQPDEEKTYFVHVDLAQKHDHCAVALAHVEHWVTMKIAGQMKDAAPKVVVDAVRWWTPTSDKSVDFVEVRDYILSLRSRGFNIKLVTFDRWNSHDMMQQMNAYGMKSEILSVAKKHYDDMQLVVTEERLVGPKITLLIDELLQLRIMKNDKVDHPRKGSKDLSDAVCGAIYNAVAHTSRNLNQEVQIYDYANYRSEEEEMESEREKYDPYVIRPPRAEHMPNDIRAFLEMDLPDDGEQRFVDNFTIL
jgi:phage terminase large subunit-like protein